MKGFDTKTLRRAMDMLEAAVRASADNNGSYEAVIARRDALESAVLDMIPTLHDAPATPDLDALAREIFAHGQTTEDIHDILSKHLSAPRAVVEPLTAHDVKVYGIGNIDSTLTLWDVYENDALLEEIAAGLNARARAGAPQPQPQWVERPAPVASIIETPAEHQVVWLEWDDGNKWGGTWGDHIAVEHVARWSADGITWHSATPATVGAWTSEVCEQFVGKRIVTNSVGYLAMPVYIGGAEVIAQSLELMKVDAVHILPERQEVGA